MRFVVDIHQLADRCVSVFLRRRERLMPQEFLNGTKVSSVGKQVRRKRVPQRVRMKIPIDIREPHVFLNQPSDGTLREPSPRIVQEDGLRVRGPCRRPRGGRTSA